SRKNDILADHSTTSVLIRMKSDCRYVRPKFTSKVCLSFENLFHLRLGVSMPTDIITSQAENSRMSRKYTLTCALVNNHHELWNGFTEDHINNKEAHAEVE
ncbi:FMN-dependent oxidoreductase, partial [Striga asiatica]